VAIKVRSKEIQVLNENKLLMPHSFEDSKYYYDQFHFTKKQWLRWTKLIKEPQDTKKYNEALIEAYEDLLNGYHKLSRLCGNKTSEYIIAEMRAHEGFRILMHLKSDEPRVCPITLDFEWKGRTPSVF